MNLATRAQLARRDQLLLASHVLQAIELGHMQMDAAEYGHLTSWVAEELDRLDTEVLQGLRQRAPEAVLGVIENLLLERGEASWCGTNSECDEARSVWNALQDRLAVHPQKPAIGDGPSPIAAMNFFAGAALFFVGAALLGSHLFFDQAAPSRSTDK